MNIRIFKKFYFGVVLLMIFLIFSGCADQGALYKNDAFRIKVRYPPDWEKKEYYGETLVTFLTPSLEDDPFIENINIVVQEFGLNISLEEYNREVLGTIELMGTAEGVHLELLSSSPRTISRRPAHQAVYVLTQYGYPQEVIDAGVVDPIDIEGQSFKILQVWTIRGNRSYILTYLALQDSYDEFSADVEAMIDSIQIF